jgi:hypothetical protein
MDLPIKYIASIALVIMVILGLITAATDMFKTSGGDIKDESNKQQDNLDCIFDDRDNARDCLDESSAEVTPDVWKG